MRRSFAFGLGSVVLGLASCADDSPVASPLVGNSPGASSPAALRLASLRQRFVLPSPEPAALLAPDAPQAQGSPRSLLPASQAERWVVREGWLYPEIPDTHRRGITRPASVRLPPQATGAFEVTDDTSGMKLSVARVGARPAALEQAEGWAMYRGALGEGSEVLHRATAEGTEDYVHLASKPEKEELRYVVDVSAVAGLRLVSNVLEFVNAEGDPRLRLTAPMLVDGGGKRRELKIGVEGCAYSSDPAPPWGKAVTAPGASQCEVVVRWEAGAVYPVVVDPNWTASGNMVQMRTQHTASALSDGRVLVVGGSHSSASSTSEVWSNGTWAVSGNLAQPRFSHTASVLPDGRILVVGGFGSPSNKTSEVWSNGTWTVSGNMIHGWHGHTASILPDGRVLVVADNNGSKQCEVWSSGTWAVSGLLSTNRITHAASRLPDGRVLVVGGGTPPSNTSEVWLNEKWTASGNMIQSRSGHTASTLPDGRVLVVGGDSSKKTSEVWLNGTWTASGNTVQARGAHTASVLPDGRVLVVGENTSEVWLNGTWTASGNMVHSRQKNHTASVLPDGRVLVVGGAGSPSTSEVWSEDKPLGQTCLFPGQCTSGFCVDGVCCESACTQGYACIQTKTGKPNGQCGPFANGLVCSQGSECSSGFCVDGLCCDAACTGTCQACSAAKKAQGTDGTCGPIKSGSDPDNECLSLGVGTCQTAGFCDGSGKCESKLGSTCGQNVCSDGKIEFNVSACDDSGTCIPNIKNCSPYICQGIQCLSSCASDSDCQEQFYCNLNSKQCLPQNAEPNTPCSSNSQCASKFCVDGYCCNEACTGTCRACSTAKKGQGLNGVCGDILNNTDPDSECASQDATTCGTSGACNGQGQCALFAQGTSCGASICVAGGLTGKVCDGQGKCLDASTPVPCAPYTGCANGTTCATTCASSSDCVGTHFCNPTSKTCEPDKVAGATCEDSAECASGFCVDGVCCTTACEGACQACEASLKASGPSGVCGAVVEGSKDAGCAVAGGCGADGSCAAGGVCRTAAPSGVPCGATTCVEGVTAGKVCDGAGTCISSSGTSCGAYACSSATNACLTECSTTANCAAGYFCSQKACLPVLTAGNLCTGNEQCSSGFCVDGVCCNTACDGACVSCNGNSNQSGQNGQCGPVIGGTDPRNACNKDDANPCGKPGVCGDDGECKAFASTGTLCGPKACAGDSLTTKECDGFGACQQLSDLCPPFACDSEANACKTKCTTDKDCSTGAVCSSNGQCTLGEASCADGFTAKAPDGSLTKCDPYACLNGQCRSTCSSTTDCIVGFRCEASACVPDSTGNGGNSGNGGNGGASGSGTGGSAGSEVGGSAGSGTAGTGGAGAGGAPVASAEPSEEGGCGCRAAGTSPSGTGAGAAALVALVAVARRRRTRS